MSVPSWLDGLNTRFTGRPKVTNRGVVKCGRSRRRRLLLEVLEARRLLSLTPAVNYAVGDVPVDLVVGDFSGDGTADLGSINATQLSLLLGNGNGSFHTAQTTDVGSGLRSVAAGHFDGDGRLDLAMTSRVTTFDGSSYVNQGFINVLLNNGVDASGNVTFQPARSFSTGTNTTPGAIAVGDLNGDGKLDVAAGQSDGGNVTVLLGNGDGNLKGGGNFAVGTDPSSVAVGDINGDGKLDLVTANRWSSNVGVLLNSGNDGTGNATFQPVRNMAVDGNPEGVAVGDFDADGKLDLGVTSNVYVIDGGGCGYYSCGYYGHYEGRANVLLGNGDGSFATAKTTWVNNRPVGEVAAADFNGDGNLDVVMPDEFQATAIDPIVLLGRGDGTFDPRYHFDAGYGPIAVVAVDLNGDAAPDLGVANFSSANVSVLLNDNNWPPLGAPFVFVLEDVTVFEGDTGTTSGVFTVSLSAGFSEPIFVQFSTADGTATAGSDYQAASGTLVFSPDGPLSQTVTVLVYGDYVLERYSDSFFINLSTPGNARIHDGPNTGGIDGQGIGWIRDDESGASASSPEVVEGHSGTTDAVFTVSVGSSDEPLIIDWSTVDSTARAGSDYQASSGTLRFEPGGPQTQTVTVPVYGDRLGEGYPEYFYLDLGNGYGGYASILDDEPLISISPDLQLAEGNTGTTSAVFTVSLSRAYDEPVSVNFSTAEGDTHFEGGASPYGYYYYRHTPAATSGRDFESQTGMLTFTPGETSKTITVPVNGDRHAETWEYFSVDLANASGNAALSDGHALVTIADDEPLITVIESQVIEGNSGTTNRLITVSMAAASDGPVTVDWSTADGSAIAGSDYQASSGMLTFDPAGPLTQTVAVPVIGDRLFEYYESFYVNLGNGTWGYGTILDDEPRITISGVGIDEGDSGTISAVFTVSLAHAYDEPVTVNFSTAEGDTEAWYGYDYWGNYYPPPPAATAGSDFQSQSGSLTIAAGQTSAIINVIVNGDTIVEETEYFSVNLTGPSANAAISDGHAVGMIIDDDESVTKFYVVDASSDKTFEYDEPGVPVENYALRSGNNDPRGAASDASGELVWVIDNDDYIYVYDAAGNSLGLWKAKGLSAPEGIASDGTDLWIVDRGKDRIFRFAGAASRTSGSVSASSSFALNSGNGDAKGIETDGTHLWVVNDASTDKVFKYTLSGALRGSWTIGGTNTPTGITLDPSSPSDVWIVDAGYDQVFQYAAAANRTSGSQSASAVFGLPAGNKNPQGIADPPPPAETFAAKSAELSNPADLKSRVHSAALWVALAERPAHSIVAARLTDQTPLVISQRPTESAASAAVKFTPSKRLAQAPRENQVKENHEHLKLCNVIDTIFADAEALDEIGDIFADVRG